MAEPAGNLPSSGDANTPSRFDPYGPNALADETRQAQMTYANDTPTDVNYNAVVCRAQTDTEILKGKNFEASANRANNAFNIITQVLLGEYAVKPKA